MQGLDCGFHRAGCKMCIRDRRYQGQRDIPLSPEGAAQLRRADFDPDVVYVSTLQRTSQTARILFPEAKQMCIRDRCWTSAAALPCPSSQATWAVPTTLPGRLPLCAVRCR